MPPTITNTFDISKKNAAGKEVYVKISSAMIKYYNTYILKKKSAVEAIKFYKGSGYYDINMLLTMQMQPTLVVNPSNSAPHPQSQKDQQDPQRPQTSNARFELESMARKAAKEAYKNKVVAPVIKHIKELDKIIAGSPNIIKEPVHVYRGMTYDIISDTYCENGKMFYTFRNYVSTSFTPSVSRNFANSGCMYTLILDKGVKGIYVSFEVTQSLKNFQNVYLDSEVELLLPRGTTFEVIGLEFVQMPPQFYRFKDVPCVEKKLSYVKHYTLKFVSHASEKELKQSLNQAIDVVDGNITIVTL
jgi:hypothetical protein